MSWKVATCLYVFGPPMLLAVAASSRDLARIVSHLRMRRPE
jgi:hypothetical protein